MLSSAAIRLPAHPFSPSSHRNDRLQRPPRNNNATGKKKRKKKPVAGGNVNPIGERSCYDEGKRAAECLAMDYHREHGTEVRIVRIFNTYGPRMALDDGRVVSNFVAQALQGEPITVYGDGQQTRSFQYVSDLVAGLVAVMEGDQLGPFNIGNPGEFTMLQLAELVREIVGNGKSEIVFRENTADDPTRRRPDIGKMKLAYGWAPKVELREGIVRMLDDFKRRLHVA